MKARKAIGSGPYDVHVRNIKGEEYKPATLIHERSFERHHTEAAIMPDSALPVKGCNSYRQSPALEVAMVKYPKQCDSQRSRSR